MEWQSDQSQLFAAMSDFVVSEMPNWLGLFFDKWCSSAPYRLIIVTPRFYYQIFPAISIDQNIATRARHDNLSWINV